MLDERVGSMDEAWAKAAEILREIRARYAKEPSDKYPRGGMYTSSKVINDPKEGVVRTIDQVVLLVEFKREHLSKQSVDFLTGLDFFDDYQKRVSVLEYPKVVYCIPYNITEKPLRQSSLGSQPPDI